jgi:hypothetical protein
MPFGSIQGLRPNMKLASFQKSLSHSAPPEGLGLPLQALWWDAKGNWDKAHQCAQADEDDPSNQWVHAYLHRKEGDQSNAGYWYGRCGKPPCNAALKQEWDAITLALLDAG